MGSSSSIQKSKKEDGEEKTEKTNKEKPKTLEEHLESLKEAIESLKQCSDFKTKDCNTLFLTIRAASSPPGIKVNERDDIVNLMVELDYASLFPVIWSDLHSVDLSKGHGKKKSTEDPVPYQAMSNLKNFKAAWWTFTDWSKTLAEELGKTDGLKLLVSDMEDPDLALDKMNSESRRLLIKGTLGTVHNMVRQVSMLRYKIRHIHNCVSLLTTYSRSTFLIIQAKAFLVLSYILCEHEYATLEATDNAIGFLVGMLRESLNYKSHRTKKYGFSSIEILQGLNQIALNDHNKVKIMDNGAVPLMVRMLGENCSNEEHRLASEGLWKLAFVDDNRQRMRENMALIEGLLKLKNSEDNVTREQCLGALWEIMEGAINLEMDSLTAEELVKSEHKRKIADYRNDSHVMISYQWDVQESMLLLRDSLKSDGYNVWMDVDKLDGDILGAMADAVEKAAVVLVCFSQKYKDSQSCRTEATYAYKQNKQIVPLMVEQDYTPDGWLGALIGTLKYYKFYDEPSRPAEYTELLHTLGNMGKKGYVMPKTQEPSKASMPAQISREPTLAAQSTGGKMSTWSTTDVENWLKENHLQELVARFKDVDGEMLFQMLRQSQRAPEFFHNAVSKELGLNYIQLLKFTRALEKSV